MENLREKIQKRFISYLLTHKKTPSSVFSFMEELNEPESAFYEHFSSFADLERKIWEDFATSTLERMKSEAAYTEYSNREKLLSFCFTLIEVLKPHRSYAVGVLTAKKPGVPATLKGFREKLKGFADDLVNASLDTGEMHNRPFISDRYADLVWLEVLSVMKFWAKDQSTAFERTDAFVEKTVNLFFDLLAKTPLDSAIDLLRFMIRR